MSDRPKKSPFTVLGVVSAAVLIGVAVSAIKGRPLEAAGWFIAGSAYGLARRKAWAYKILHTAGWIGLLGAIIRSINRSSPTGSFLDPSVLPPLVPDFAAPILCLLVVHRQRKKVQMEPSEKPVEPSVGYWLRENVESIVVAFVMALVIRCFSIEVFKIPTASMEPTLMGDFGHRFSSAYFEQCPFCERRTPIMHGGDRIMVTKHYYHISSVERFDVAVFRFPLNQSRNFIKRVVGLPEEELYVEKGDIWVRHQSERDQDFRLAKKPWRIQKSIWIPVQQAQFLRDRQIFEEYWKVKPLAEGLLHTPYTIRDGKLMMLAHERSKNPNARFEYGGAVRDVAGVRYTPENVSDVMIALEFEAAGREGTVFAEVVTELGTFRVELSPTDDNRLSYVDYTDPLRPTREMKLRTGHIGTDRLYRLTLGVYDGKAVVELDGRIEAEVDFLVCRSQLPALDPGAKIAFGAKDMLLTVSLLTTGRDIHYRSYDGGNIPAPGESGKIPIPSGCYLMMGDNVGNSHDSRAWTRHVFFLKDGRQVECESQGLQERGSQITIESDIHGNPRGFDRDDLDPAAARPYYNQLLKSYEEIKARYGEDASGVWKPYLDGGSLTVGGPFVHERFILGKAFWIWWPPGRWFRMIQ